ncbi:MULTISPECIES: chemotaxis protein CheA [unclassified Virgibacillus]|uniref:chemotaxis protein CheA n=1 Tax=unclassified Virgibacillus TaxID=2620237 RepID=UPI0024DEEABB|nr:chemotaxis protein CheA [Virgibacillus sp. LDC-1]
MDTTQYLDVFIDESTEHLEVLYKQLLELEKKPSEKTIIEEIFRAAHTLKGMSATMGYQDLANLTHKLENVFDGIRYDKLSVQASMLDILFEAVDHLNAMVEDISNGGNGARDVVNIALQLEKLENGETVDSDSTRTRTADSKEAVSTQAFDHLDEFELSILNESLERGFHNYEIMVELTNDCLLKGARVFMIFEILEKLGEVIKSSPAVTELEEENFDTSFNILFVSTSSQNEIKNKINKVSEIHHVEVTPFSVQSNKTEREEQLTETDVAQAVSDTEANNNSTSKTGASTKTIRVNIERLDMLMNLFEELVIDRGRLEQIAMDVKHPELEETVERMTRVSGNLQNIILTMRMVPVDQVFSRFPRMIRKLARELHKNIELDIIGADTELDRTVIDEIGDPLVHLLRNAIDHGIETPEERLQKGKQAQGTIKLEAFHSGNHVFIEISDDGAGINKDKVLNKAIKSGVITEKQSEALTDQQIFELIMESGFSTAEEISDISGRGVGLDVVKNKIESLGGNLTIDSEVGKGSVFSIQLPLTLSIMSVLLVEIGKEKFAIPLSSIIETAVIRKDEIMSAHKKKIIDFRGNVVPLAFLKRIFQVPQEEKEADEYVSVVVVKKGDKLAGLVVDSFIGQQEVVLKSMGDYLSNIFAISGATILGNGEVALIIDSNALIK